MSKLIVLIKKTLQREFVRSFIILFSGSTVAQAIPLLATIVLARIFSNDSFGLLFLYSTTVMLLSIFATLKYELAIVLPKNEIEAINLLVLSFLICLFFSLALLLIVFLFSEKITSLLDNRNIQKWLYYLPLSVFFTGIFQSTNNWFLWQKKYKNISAANISKATGAAATQLSLGYSKFSNLGLIPGLIAGQFLSAAINVYYAFISIKPKLKHVSINKMKFLAYKHKNLPLYSTLLGFSNTLSNQLPILLLTKYFGLTATSFYGMAHRLIGAPMGLIGSSVSKIFFKKASDIFNTKQDLTRFLKDTYLNLFKIGIIPFMVIFAIAPYIVKLALGENWGEVANYLRIILPWLFLMFLNSPVTHIITVLKKQKQMLVYDICLLTSRFLALFSGYYFFNSAIVSIALFSIIGVLFNITLFFLLLHLSKNKTIKQSIKSN